MTIFVTGGAGFIDANFVLDWIACSDEPVVNLDKLTYAGNLENLASLQGNPSTSLCRTTTVYRREVCCVACIIRFSILRASWCA